ncbi:hypothetical protein M408DRAFT_5352 [Serendipita vermifera MAFF 305830]|uniref:Orc1-like AAA ATPase domain-containing protein n=1 Tax=Serendipita vermifera MAFF 305830 TaxID=933852 RepID=A0A0C2XYJ2_SERVB|nr:hypothetical protein M408DRAFT_5352 [Serendipita vermifera MAFF 305830]
MPPKRKRASSPIIDTHKRAKRVDDSEGRDSERETGPASRASRRKTITAVTPLRKGVVTSTVLQRTPVKQRYAKSLERVPKGAKESDVDEDEDEEEPEITKPSLRSAKDKKKELVPDKVAKNSTIKAKAEKPSQQVPVTPAKATKTPANKSQPNKSSSGAVFDDETPLRGRRRASSPHSEAARKLVLDKLPSKVEMTRMLKKHKHRATNDADMADAEDETQPTPCPPRQATAQDREPNPTETKKSKNAEVITPRMKRIPGKSSGRPLANLGTLLDKQLSQASRSSKYKESISSLGESMSEDEEATPTKPAKPFAAAKGLIPKTTTPRNVAKFFPSSSSIGSHKIADSTPLRRPKKGRPSYTAKVDAVPVFDLAKSDAVSQTSSVRDELAVDSMVRSTPIPDTDSEYSGTEGDLTPASARAFVESSSPMIRYGDQEEDEMENDGTGEVILDESTMPVSQPVSPSKNALPKTLPEKFHRFIEPQKRLVMKMLRSPPFIDIAPPVLDERAPVEATAYHQLIDLLKGTCERGEGNSCLLLGPRGSGKTLVLNSALEACSSNPIILRLSGHTQTTDRLAMREIAYQLTHQTGVAFNIPDEEEGGDQGKSTEPGPDEQVDFTPPAAYLPALISQLTSLKRPVVVVLDAFDLFVSHPRQALLYCLLDTAQSCRAGDGRNGLLVVGASCVVNCVNYLEKRVKSRFSHRILKVANPPTLDEYLAVARRLLGAPLDETEVEGDKRGKAALAEWRELWKTSVEHFMSHKTTRTVLSETFAFRRDIGNLTRILCCCLLLVLPST